MKPSETGTVSEPARLDEAGLTLRGPVVAQEGTELERVEVVVGLDGAVPVDILLLPTKATRELEEQLLGSLCPPEKPVRARLGGRCRGVGVIRPALRLGAQATNEDLCARCVDDGGVRLGDVVGVLEEGDDVLGWKARECLNV